MAQNSDSMKKIQLLFCPFQRNSHFENWSGQAIKTSMKILSKP